MFIFGTGFAFTQETEIHYKNWKNNCKFKTRLSRFVINNKNEFAEMSNCKLVNFDFDKYTIIGVQGTSPGHFEPIVNIRILENDNNKKIIVEVILSGGKLCETCKVAKPYYKRVIYTDKLKSDYEIEFNYIKLDE